MNENTFMMLRRILWQDENFYKELKRVFDLQEPIQSKLNMISEIFEPMYKVKEIITTAGSKDLLCSIEQYYRFMVSSDFFKLDKDTLETPFRVVKHYSELSENYVNNIEMTSFYRRDYDGYVAIKNIEYYSLCSHHHLPFFGTVSVVYKPTEYLIGLSKVSRVVEAISSAPQTQENFVAEIVEFLMKYSEGVYVHCTGRHMCMEMRGVKKKGETITAEVKGDIDKNEALQLII